MRSFIYLLLFLTTAAQAETHKDYVLAPTDRYKNKAMTKEALGFSDHLKGLWSVKKENIPVIPLDPTIDPVKYNIDQQRALIEFNDTGFSCERPNLSCFSVKEGEELVSLENDLKVCSCLQYRFDIKIGLDMSRDVVQRRNMKIEEGKLDAALERFKNQFEKRRDALLLEAHFTSKEQLSGMKQIMNTKEGAETLTAIIEQYRGKVSDTYIDNILKKINQASVAQAKKDEEGKTILENFNETTKKEDSCFPYSEYLKVTMIPNSNLFWEDIKNNTVLASSNSWDYYHLLREHDSGVNKELNRVKLDFLNRNPSIKAIFQGGNEDLKKQAYERIRNNLNPTDRCIRDGNCRANFIAKGKSLQEGISDILERPDIKNLFIGTSFSENISDMTQIGTVSSEQVPGLEALRYGHAKNNITYSQCTDKVDEKLAEACGTFFAGYCQDLLSSQDALTKLLSKREGDDKYAHSWERDLEVDPINNKNYMKFQKGMCQDMARKYKGQYYNYPGFKDVYCKTNICGDSKHIFQAFMKLASETDLEFDSNQALVKVSSLENNALARASVDRQIQVGTVALETVNDVKKSNPFSNSGGRSGKQNPSITELLAELDSDKDKLNNLNRVSSSDFNGETETASDNPGENMNKNFGNHTSLGDQGFINSTYVNDSAISDARNELNNLKSEEKRIKQEVSEVESEIARNKDPQINIALNSRLENLERMLAEKEKSSQEYQKLISKLLDNKKASENASIASKRVSEKVVDEGGKLERPRAISTGAVVASKTPTHEDQSMNQNRGPASVESFSTTGSVSGGGGAFISSSSTSLGSSAGRGKLNGALLSKYGIVVQEYSGSSVAVAQEAEGMRFQSMNSFKNADNLPLEVSQKAFDQFKANDLTVLQELYKNSLESLDDEVVRILVSSQDSSETLEFYAIKEEGKVVFQPIRKNKLTDLQNVLTH